MDCMIRLTSVTKRFGAVTALDAVELDVRRGEFLALLGPSGCGKTTLLRVVAGFEEPDGGPDGGSVEIDGRAVAGASWVAPEHRHVGFVFQDYALFPHLTVAQNVGFGLERRARRDRVAEVLALVGLADHGRRYPHELSGGQQQRVALARALAPRPEVVLLDEPWSNIDPLLRASMRDEVASILRSVSVTAVLVTHDREEAFALADRIAVMRDGRIVQTGTPEHVYAHPDDRWVAGFVGAANFVEGRVASGRVESAIGAFPALDPGGRSSFELLVRPELLVLEPSADGEAEVIGREFRGHDLLYRLRLTDGTVLLAQRPSTEAVELGARVALRPVRDAVTILP
jgi:iron(III) transport system ATP-binding protein